MKSSYLVIIFIIHLLGLNNVINSGDKTKIIFQSTALTWCGVLLMFPTLDRNSFIFLVTLIYSFSFLVLLWVYNKTGQNIIGLALFTQGLLSLLGLIALLS
jgi:hypothetical protein